MFFIIFKQSAIVHVQVSKILVLLFRRQNAELNKQMTTTLSLKKVLHTVKKSGFKILVKLQYNLFVISNSSKVLFFLLVIEKTFFFSKTSSSPFRSHSFQPRFFHKTRMIEVK